MNARRRRIRGFTLVEALVSLSVSSMVVASVVAAYSAAQRQAVAPAKELAAFSIAQQRIEMLSSVPATSPLLADTVPGDPHDPEPLDGVDGPPVNERFVDGLGMPASSGKFQVYWKIDNPFGAVKNVVVYCEYVEHGEVRRVQLETYR